jgi:hypothetical protein
MIVRSPRNHSKNSPHCSTVTVFRDRGPSRCLGDRALRHASLSPSRLCSANRHLHCAPSVTSGLPPSPLRLPPPRPSPAHGPVVAFSTRLVAAFSTGVASSMPPVNSMRRRASICKQQGDVAMKEYVASLCFKCFRRFIGMLQVFYMDIAKVKLGCYICWNCCTHMLQDSVSHVLSVF